MKALSTFFKARINSYKAFPVYSLIGYCLVIITLLINIAFRIVSDIGLKIILSTFSSLFLILTTIWLVMGVIELLTLIKTALSLKKKLSRDEIENDVYRNRFRRLKKFLIINIGYIVLILLQIVYVIFNWEKLNI
ncbi:hypothetical protein J40TS1_37870 [Paenibacillus montaniterrae]|uniref:Uncharacterized protein n=1 Tax=Paenibacillus montaniterrae TaxID=429341 RepID=A0A919YRL8_9BACL|nr:hypothetical protein [Paenibacillus montaniterrae]GIP18145.1 hypothetical protein J40TS1_37870 [Paenibacillus montaniterrae]